MQPKANNILALVLIAAIIAAIGAFAFSKPSKPAVKLEIPKLFSSITARGAVYAKQTLELRGEPVTLTGFAASDPNIPDRFVLMLLGAMAFGTLTLNGGLPVNARRHSTKPPITRHEKNSRKPSKNFSARPNSR